MISTPVLVDPPPNASSAGAADLRPPSGHPGAAHPFVRFSEVEARVIEGIAAGEATVPLASRLHLSRQDVEHHVTRLLRKLDVRSRAALVSRAYSLGVLEAGTWPPRAVADLVG